MSAKRETKFFCLALRARGRASLSGPPVLQANWGEEIFTEGVGVRWKKWARGEGEGKEKYFIFSKISQVPHPPPLPRLCTNPLPVKHPITIQDGGIENSIYLAFRSKTTPALEAF